MNQTKIRAYRKKNILDLLRCFKPIEWYVAIILIPNSKQGQI